jgi:tRNA1Val (adenine37-N6)-methyltransferase
MADGSGEKGSLTLDSIKDIRLYQSREGYRFSMDAVLLATFVNLKRAEKIIDLGAGSGIVGLLLARRYPEARVTLVELQESLYGLAERNIRLNNLGKRVNAVHCDIRAMPEGLGGFDLALSNPPFRKPLSGLLNVQRERAVARHEMEINLRGLVRAASGCLRSRGRLCMIYHPLRLHELTDELARAGLEPKRLRFVHGKASLEAKMVLLEAVRQGRAGLKVERPLFVYREEGGYTREMEDIYG